MTQDEPSEPIVKVKTDVEIKTDEKEEWKEKLQQWKVVRKAKTVVKAKEDQWKDLNLSLNQSVLLVLQSPISIRRLQKQVEGAYIRAICRTVGLNALRKLLMGATSSVFRQDICSWFSASLRRSENMLYHFTDNLKGAGFELENRVNDAFKKLIDILIHRMGGSNND